MYAGSENIVNLKNKLRDVLAVQRGIYHDQAKEDKSRTCVSC